jgi:hypothetical protein
VSTDSHDIFSRETHLALEDVEFILDGDQVKSDVEYSSQQERQEEGGSGEVHCLQRRMDQSIDRGRRIPAHSFAGRRISSQS